jgi:hypothetical protein
METIEPDRMLDDHRARTRARAETKTRRFWRSAAAVSEMEFGNLQVM